MKLSDYKRQVKAIESNAEKLKQKLLVKYCSQIDPVKIGDVVENTFGTKIKVARIGYYQDVHADFFGVYYGFIVNKNGKLNKKGGQFMIHKQLSTK